MVQRIDFLPTSYRQTRQCQKQKLSRHIILGAFLALIVTGTIQQRHVQRRLQTQSAELKQQAERLTTQLGDGEQLRKQVQQLNTQANLLTALQWQTPSTRLLELVTKTLPKFVRLTEYRCQREQAKSKPLAVAKHDTNPNSSSMELDLDELRNTRLHGELIVKIDGVAPDDVAISNYLAGLMSTQSFDDVQLLYTDQSLHQDHVLRSFAIRLHVRKPRASSSSNEQAYAPDRGAQISGTQPPREQRKPSI